LNLLIIQDTLIFVVDAQPNYSDIQAREPVRKVLYVCLIYMMQILLNDPAFSADDRSLIDIKIKEGATVVDVRTPEEYAANHFNGSINIPLSEIPDRLKDFGASKNPIIVYCQSGRRSAKAKIILVEKGFLDVTDGGALSNMPQK